MVVAIPAALVALVGVRLLIRLVLPAQVGVPAHLIPVRVLPALIPVVDSVVETPVVEALLAIGNS